MIARCISLSEHIDDLLKRERGFRILAIFDHVLNLEDGQEILSIQDTSIPQTPLSLILPNEAFGYLRDGLEAEEPFRVDSGMLCCGEHTIETQTAKRFSCQMTVAKNIREKEWYGRLKKLTVLFARPSSLAFIATPELYAWASDEITAVQKRAEDRLRRGDLHELLGLGGGLTPAGDDFLVGVLAVLRWLGKTGCHERIADRLVPMLDRTPKISRAFLVRALNGEFARPVLSLFSAMEQEDDLVEAVSGLCAVGHTSGSDLLGGVLWTLKHVHEEEIM